MGRELSKVRRTIDKPFDKIKKPLEKSVRQGLEKPVRTGASAQKRQAESLLKKQQQTEQMKLAEADDEIARRAAGAGKGGRRSLIKSSPAGLASNLGGT